MTKMEQAFNLFDTYNKQDPSETTWNGQHYPSEYFYAIKLYERVKDLAPQASTPFYWPPGASISDDGKSPEKHFLKAGWVT
ncbi:hypothetical protein [Paraflavitalea speifideaquila]|uniref:hypothetical protein n=1 Tax=Paraflavitalea speifideaquila TaxID=3076558 RepID=UPI0028E97D2F|nr:hypothetical protein [Paraflavitalea speifideiaquila]